MTSENGYRLIVDKAVKEKMDLPISNGKPEHAAYLIQKILENAEKVVRIFSGTLTRNFRGVPAYGSEQILSATHAFLMRGGNMKVILEKPIDVDDGQAWTDHPLVKEAHSVTNGSDLLEVRQASERGVNELRDAKVLYHWITMDQQAYRLEMDTTRAKAIANFGNPSTARSLNIIFDDLFAKSQHV